MDYAFNNFYELISFRAQKDRRKAAIFIDEEKIRYGQLLEKIDAFAGFLAHKGIKKGDKIALFLRNCPEFVYSVFAASKVGAIVVPINTFLKEEELSYILENSGATALIASAAYEKTVKASCAYALCTNVIWEGDIEIQSGFECEFAEALSAPLHAPQAATTPEDTAVIIYTSGTTGKPKGAMLSYKNIFSNTHSGAITINVTSKDRAIVFLPMFHSFTFSIGVILPLYVGASIVIIKSVQPFSNIFKQVLLKRVTIFFGIPDVYNALSKAKLPWYFMWFNCVRAFISGAAPLQPKTLDAMANKFKRAALLEGYGLSEASPAVSINTFKKQKAGSVGTALCGYEIKIVDENLVEVPRGATGDVIVKGDNVMKGYLGLPEATAQTIVNGWLLTGDMGYMDEEEFLFIVDRKKDLIISKGINIYPREVEEVINSFKGVAASAVIGADDEKNGEIPIAYVELEEESDYIDEAELKTYVRQRLANYKMPRQFHIVKTLPKNATGKVLKRMLKEQLKEGYVFEDSKTLKAIVNARVFVDEGMTEGKILLFDKKIVGIVDIAPKEAELIDAKGAYVSAGFIDLHIHGCGGADVMDATPLALETISSALLQTGTTSFLATTMTMSTESICRALENIKKHKHQVNGAKIVGVHLEGPFINPLKHGAQDKTLVQMPNTTWIEAYMDEVKMITLAPEIEGAPEFIEHMANQYSHVILSIGHSDANYEQSKASFEQGISHATHLFNAMNPYHHRKPGIAGAVFDADVTCDVIADLVHVHPSVLSHIFRLKKDKLILVSDSMRAGCMKEGIYELGGQKAEVLQGKVFLEDGTLAGSVLKLNEALKNMTTHTAMTLQEAVNSVTLLPAQKLGIKKGSLKAGYDADIVLFDEDFSIIMTIIEGEIKYQRE